MFQGKDGKALLNFLCIRGFPLEMMHLIDGGVLKDFLQEYVFCASKIPLPNDGSKKVTRTKSIVETEIEDAITFFRPFGLTDQARKLRYIDFIKGWWCIYYIVNLLHIYIVRSPANFSAQFRSLYIYRGIFLIYCRILVTMLDDWSRCRIYKTSQFNKMI